MKKKATYNRVTGLTAQQEKAAALLSSGERVIDVAKKLKINRSTMYNWLRKVNFRTYYDALLWESKIDLQNQINSLFQESSNVLQKSLKSQNESIRLKTALWIIEHIANQDFENKDAVEKIREKCSYDASLPDTEVLDLIKYETMLKDNNLNKAEDSLN